MSTILEKADMFAENARVIRKDFAMQSNATKLMAALLYTQAEKAMDCAAIRQSYDLIKQNTGVFSVFRGDMTLCIAALLSLTPNPQSLFNETLKVYDLLKRAKFWNSSFLAVAAYQIACAVIESEYENVVARTRAFYDCMKARHFFRTGEDDYIFSAMLGLTDIEINSGADRIEQLYEGLKREFWDKNSVQTLAQVLVLGNSDLSVQNRLFNLRDALLRAKLRMDRSYTLPLLGVLALLPVSPDDVVHDILEALSVLRTKKGFGLLSIGSQGQLLYAASLVAGAYGKNARDGVLTAALSTGIANILIAQHAAMLAAISASAAASASSSSS